MISEVESFLCPDKQESLEEGQRIQGWNVKPNKDKENSLKTLTDKKKRSYWVSNEYFAS